MNYYYGLSFCVIFDSISFGSIFKVLFISANIGVAFISIIASAVATKVNA